MATKKSPYHRSYEEGKQELESDRVMVKPYNLCAATVAFVTF